MQRYILRRIALSVPTIFGMTVVVFTLTRLMPGDVVSLMAGDFGAANAETFDGAPVLAVDCAGSLHTSVIELLVRAGAGGVLVLACPKADCWNREGAVWLEERMFHDREAELQERVDRRRVALAHASFAERATAHRALTGFRDRVAAIEHATSEEDFDLLRLCDVPAHEEDVA